LIFCLPFDLAADSVLLPLTFLQQIAGRPEAHGRGGGPPTSKSFDAEFQLSDAESQSSVARFQPFEAEFQAARDLWHAGKRADAISVLQDLVARYPHEALSHGMLGGFLFNEGRLFEALDYTKKATELAPRSVLAAGVHFHTLYHLDRRREALAELRRFYAVAGSEELRREWAQLIRDAEALEAE